MQNDNQVERPVADGRPLNAQPLSSEIDGPLFVLVDEGEFAPRIAEGKLIVTVVAKTAEEAMSAECQRFAYDQRGTCGYPLATLDAPVAGQIPLASNGSLVTDTRTQTIAFYGRQFKLRI